MPIDQHVMGLADRSRNCRKATFLMPEWLTSRRIMGLIAGAMILLVALLLLRSDEDAAVRKQLKAFADVASKSGAEEPPLAMVAKASALMDFFTDEAVIDPGGSTRPHLGPQSHRGRDYANTKDGS